MRRHIGVVVGAAMAGVGVVLAIGALAGFSLLLPAVQPATALGASWFMIAVVLMIVGAFVGLAARGVELEHADHEPMPRPVRHLHLVRR